MVDLVKKSELDQGYDVVMVKKDLENYLNNEMTKMDLFMLTHIK